MKLPVIPSMVRWIYSFVSSLSLAQDYCFFLLFYSSNIGGELFYDDVR
jgi:hypothetical protein